MMPEYRKAHGLVQEQAELIERLMKERDFYRRNCHHRFTACFRMTDGMACQLARPVGRQALHGSGNGLSV